MSFRKKNKLLLHYYKPGYRPATGGEESPDSTEQCTSEELGPALAGTDSATENNYPEVANPLQGKDENVG